MSKQEELIGSHPSHGPLSTWLSNHDYEITDTQCHRSLTELTTPDTNWIAKCLVEYHHSPERLAKIQTKKAILEELKFNSYAAERIRLPAAELTQRGNLTEILLTEYLKYSLGVNLVFIHRLRYNTNIDQSMKGDDVLLIDYTIIEGKPAVKLYLGEAKFRGTPSKQVIDEISKALSKDKEPLSYTFVLEELEKQPDTKNLAIELDAFLVSEIKNKNAITYAGLVLSTNKIGELVQKHLNCDNNKMVMLSLAIENPEAVVSQSFQKAQNIIIG